jgi:protein ImuB
VWSIGPGREHWDALEGMGLRTLAELRRLPRGGLARRFGPAVLSELDRAYGDCPDPLEPIVLPPSFESRLELFARADTTEQVLYGAGVLLARLVPWLSAQHAFVRRFSLVMQHEPRWRRDSQTPSATTLDVALAEPCWCCCANGWRRSSCPHPRSSCACMPKTSRDARRRTTNSSPPRAAKAKASRG